MRYGGGKQSATIHEKKPCANHSKTFEHSWKTHANHWLHTGLGVNGLQVLEAKSNMVDIVLRLHLFFPGRIDALQSFCHAVELGEA